MKKVFPENWYRLAVNVCRPDVCLWKEDLCLPVVPLTSLCDSLADSCDMVVTVHFLSFVHMAHDLAQSSLHLSPVSEHSQKAVLSKGFLHQPQGLLPGISERLTLFLEVRGEKLPELKSFEQWTLRFWAAVTPCCVLEAFLDWRREKEIMTVLSRFWGLDSLMAPHLVTLSMTSWRTTEWCAHKIWRRGSASHPLLLQASPEPNFVGQTTSAAGSELAFAQAAEI